MYVETPAQGRVGCLRVYNNGKSEKKVRLYAEGLCLLCQVATEHAILAQLARQRLPFAVPKALPTRATGEPYVVLSSGDAACVFELIPGELAKTTRPEEVGRALGELCRAMAEVRLEDRPPVPPYYDLFNVHKAVGTAEAFYADIAQNPAFDDPAVRPHIDYLTERIRAVEPLLQELPRMGLPMQLIHGDVHFDNVLVEGDTVTGLLDFEFPAYDLRMFELAVGVSKYVSEDDPLPLMARYIQGYARGGGELTAQEAELLPDAIALRIFSNVVYFTGRER